MSSDIDKIYKTCKQLLQTYDISILNKEDIFTQSVFYSLANKYKNTEKDNKLFKLIRKYYTDLSSMQPDLTHVVNVKVKYIRPKYNDLKEWVEDSENNVYIGRKGIVFVEDKETGKKSRYPKEDSLWANPYKIDKNTSREQVIEKYHQYIINKIEKENLYFELEKLRGKNLGCWCKEPGPNILCHGDVLVELLNKM